MFEAIKLPEPPPPPPVPLEGTFPAPPHDFALMRHDFIKQSFVTKPQVRLLRAGLLTECAKALSSLARSLLLAGAYSRFLSEEAFDNSGEG